MALYQNYHLQHGQGLGGIISGLFKRIAPIITSGAKMGIKTGKKILKSDTTKRALNDISHHAKDVLIDIAQDALSGQNIKQSANTRLQQGRKRIADELSANMENLRQKKQNNTPRKRRKKEYLPRKLVYKKVGLKNQNIARQLI